ncbi:luciferase family oxidoreductase group 1 [Flavobacterium sp. CG_23.5]|uniref:LLM class flavin-dependent oxidoreductase n=1 Tax=unclassified Flavobacterium TaxID=196869 RepID=UPI0018CB11F6|nr:MULTISPECIES: LLM class flavin-dependent oxidoreductase [unclassified Flavobacterium]MBG6111318.1 luciferase family oxidoreductase group 1 [Flavobacterium sp. CG_9.10]MBP2282105.1 luciferase family oxidoreductase group 1 [Flavobacterium sp. CG_23.5]
MTKKNISQTKISVLDLAIVREGGTASDTFKNSLDLAQHVEKWGYNRFWLAEHHNMQGIASSSPSILIGHIASGTSTLRVGSGGVMLPNHAPLMIAEQFGTLATLFPHRIDLGLGRAPGTDQFTAAALRRDDHAAMEFPANVQELQMYLSEGNKNGRVRAIPGEGLDIPIWILGSSTDSAYLAASLGLPYAFASHFAPAQLLTAIAIYRNNFQPSEDLKESYVIACVNVIAADSDDEAARLATSFKRLFLGIITGNRQQLKPPVSPDNFMDPMEEAALQQMIAYSFIGGPEKVKKELDYFLDKTQVDELMIATAVYEHTARLHSYEIIGNLKNS